MVRNGAYHLKVRVCANPFFLCLPSANNMLVTLSGPAAVAQ